MAADHCGFHHCELTKKHRLHDEPLKINEGVIPVILGAHQKRDDTRECHRETEFGRLWRT